jgi:UDP-N-acetylmuramate dehydrogenase
MNGFSLKPYNTFGVEGYTRRLIPIKNEEDILGLDTDSISSYKILGGGSNILITGDINQTVLKNEIVGVDIIQVNENEVFVKIGSGENWHTIVKWALENNLSGIENLSLIPGSTGAAPVQNIGAYGVELKDVLFQVEGIFIKDKKRAVFKNQECQFSYRSSIFKHELKEQFFITYVVLRLSKKHTLKLDYGAIQTELKARNIKTPTIQDVSEIVIHIRNSKLPDPAMLGNAGSFFKNSIISTNEFNQLKHKYPEIPFYNEDEGFVKIPSGWLIEQCGWKGIKKGPVGCYAKQALVLVNYGSATGKDILDFSNEIKDSVFQKFGIQLSPEVNIW